MFGPKKDTKSSGGLEGGGKTQKKQGQERHGDKGH